MPLKVFVTGAFLNTKFSIRALIDRYIIIGENYIIPTF